MKVVVLMSTYNGEKYIKEQINSILNQKRTYVGRDGYNQYFELDIIVRDDGSKDRTIQLLEEYKKTGKISFYQGNNLGSSRSFFDLILAVGEYNYYALSDQDDYWLPDKLSRAIEMIEKQDCNDRPFVYGSNAQLVDKQLNPLRSNFYPHPLVTDLKTISCSCGFLGCTMVFNDVLAKKLKDYDPPQNAVMHDYYITLLCLVINGVAFYDTSAKILYRQHGDNVCGASFSIMEKIKNHLAVFRSHPTKTIDKQAGEILQRYSNEIHEENRQWMSKISNYRSSVKNRLSLGLSNQYHFYSLTRAIPMRLQIIFGKI